MRLDGFASGMAQCGHARPRCPRAVPSSARRRTVDPDRLALAISSFEPVWNELFPREQERILRLLIAGITYHPDTGDADIELRPCGIETLASEARP